MDLQLIYSKGFPGGSGVKNPPGMQETWVRSLGWEDPLGEGHGNPLRYSCLENPMDGEAWRATGHGVAKSGVTDLQPSTFLVNSIYIKK